MSTANVKPDQDVVVTEIEIAASPERVFKALTDQKQLFTWWAPWRNMRQRNIGWRLDYVLASKPIASRVASCAVQREFGTSDHGPVVMTYQ